MASFRSYQRLVWLFGISWLIGVVEARGQSTMDAQKRSFARLLARGDRDSAADARRSTAAAARAVGRGVGASHSPLSMSVAPGIARSTLPFLAVRNRASSDDFDGLGPVTPVNPSGFGAGRDAFVETMYYETFGREIKQRELDHLARPLFRGMDPNTLATILWRSPEHRAMLRSHQAHADRFAEAYREALASGRAARSAHLRQGRVR